MNISDHKIKLSRDFYTGRDVVAIAQSLLGKELVTSMDGVVTSGIIVETEAYSYNERACHAYGKKHTARTSTMFALGGTAYVYLCYGIHRLFNVVTNVEDEPEAVLIRAVEPRTGHSKMAERRGMGQHDQRLTSGPGKLTVALGIDMAHNQVDLLGKAIWINDHADIDRTMILTSSRIGVDYAGEDALLPWRFTIKNNPWVSH